MSALSPVWAISGASETTVPVSMPMQMQIPMTGMPMQMGYPMYQPVGYWYPQNYGYYPMHPNYGGFGY